jgi:hypothetical protein
MNINEIKNELVKALKFLKAESLADASETPTSLDANSVQISERAVGGKVELIGSDGTLSVAPDGTYELSDGFKFTVKEGLIDSIIGEGGTDAGAADETMANEGGNSADAAPEAGSIDELKKTIAENSQAIAELRDEIASFKQLLESLQGNVETAASKEDVKAFKEEVTKLSDSIIKLAKLPVENTKTNKSTIAKDKKEDKLMEFIKAIKK